MSRFWMTIAICTGLCTTLYAQGLLTITREEQPPATTTVERGPGYVSISYPAAEGEKGVTIGLIEVNYWDPGYLAELLGGTALRLTPLQPNRQNRNSYQQPWNNSPYVPNYGQPGTQYQQGGGPYLPGSPNPVARQGYAPASPLLGGLNLDAPLAPFVPQAIEGIVGIVN